MGIRVDFLIKHVRPADEEAWEMICQDPNPESLSAWLLTANVSQAEIDQAFCDWKKLASLDIRDPTNLPSFVRAAQDISQARWSELYATDNSTIMFLNAPLLKELSAAAGKKPNAQFSFSQYENLPLAVTINRLGTPPEAIYNSAGAVITADENGNCCHFDRLQED